MPDRIRITDLHCRTFIGIEDWEQKDRQEVRLDLEIEADLTRAAASDRIEDTVNYRSITKRVLALVEGERYGLVERLAGAVASMVLEEFDGVTAITVRVEKPGALRFARSVGVEIRRERSSS
ncbi:MAG: dihydroneopterin aldolase [Planctomycetota bacterium]|jgi:FolB domain-containing protein